MKKQLILGILFLMVCVAGAYADAGSVWTTNSVGEIQDQNIYAPGENVYLNAAGFDANVSCSYSVEKVNNPSKGIVDAGNVQMDSNGGLEATLVFETEGALAGEYKVEVDCGGGKKSDNFKVGEGNQVPEFGLIAGLAALSVAGAGYLGMRKRR